MTMRHRFKLWRTRNMRSYSRQEFAELWKHNKNDVSIDYEGGDSPTYRYLGKVIKIKEIK